MPYLFEKKSRFRFVLYGFGMLLIFATTALFSTGAFFFPQLFKNPQTPDNQKLILMFLPFLGGLLALFLTVKYLLKIPFKRFITTRDRVDFKRFFVAFIFWGGFVCATHMVLIFLYSEHFVWNFQPLRFLSLFLIGCFFVPIQSAFEEIFFRGYFAQMIFTVFRARFWVVFLSAVFFALMHFYNPEVVSLGYPVLLIYFLWGVFFALIAFCDGGLELSIGMHTAHNLSLALLVSYNHGGTVLKTDALFLSDMPLMSVFGQLMIFVVFAVVAFYFFYKRYHWH